MKIHENEFTIGSRPAKPDLHQWGTPASHNHLTGVIIDNLEVDFDRGLGEECGIFGGFAHKGSIAPFLRSGLFALQHRGQESAGICYGDKDLAVIKNRGLVMEVLTDNIIQNVKDKIGIGHVRYSTQGASDNLHAQPYMVNHLGERVAIAHNGNVQSAIKMRTDFEKRGEVFLTSSDTEMILKKVVRDIRKPSSKWTFAEVGNILKNNFTGGAWSILFAFPGKVMAFRDPSGFRPLMLCEAEEGYFVSSEDSAFQLLDVIQVIEIAPGEGVEITPNGYKIMKFAKPEIQKQCVFEHIYFARPDSNIFGRNVYKSRVEIGKKCAIENPVDADIVVPVMDSGFAAAIGYSHQSSIPLEMGLLRNHWVGRTFIKPQQEERRSSVREKLSPIREIISGKKIILVDDSLVRGTTSREIVRMLKNAGAREVHLRIASPMLVNVCYWGVDIPTKEELIANSFVNIEKLNNYIESDSLAYISFEGLKHIFGDTGWCYHCFERI